MGLPAAAVPIVPHALRLSRPVVPGCQEFCAVPQRSAFWNLNRIVPWGLAVWGGRIRDSWVDRLL